MSFHSLAAAQVYDYFLGQGIYSIMLNRILSLL